MWTALPHHTLPPWRFISAHYGQHYAPSHQELRPPRHLPFKVAFGSYFVPRAWKVTKAATSHPQLAGPGLGTRFTLVQSSIPSPETKMVTPGESIYSQLCQDTSLWILSHGIERAGFVSSRWWRRSSCQWVRQAEHRKRSRPSHGAGPSVPLHSCSLRELRNL